MVVTPTSNRLGEKLVAFPHISKTFLRVDLFAVFPCKHYRRNPVNFEAPVILARLDPAWAFQD